MAQPRKKPAAPGVVSTKADVLDDEGFYCLKGELLWKYRAMDAEYGAAQARLKQLTAAVQMEIDKNPVLKELLAEKAEALGHVSVAMTALNAVNCEIEKALGVELKNCGIDEKTGRVHVVHSDGTEAPLAPTEQKTKTKRVKPATAKG